MAEVKNAVVTGSNRGIGRAIVRKLAQAGYNVWACARQESEVFESDCTDMSAEFSVWVRPVYFDLSDEDAVKAGAKSITREKLSIDVLVNNAGVLGQAGLFTMTRMEDIRAQFDINFFNQMLFTQVIVKHMMKRKQGSIVNMVSISALDGYGVQLGYVSSKAAMVGATKRLARELAPFHIRVNAVAPGMVNTDMAASMTEEQTAEVVERIIMKRPAETEEIADSVLFLASEQSRYITGQIVRVDGGM